MLAQNPAFIYFFHLMFSFTIDITLDKGIWQIWSLHTIVSIVLKVKGKFRISE